MPVYKNDDPAQGRYCISPTGNLVYHEASQKTKTGWRECESEDLLQFDDAMLIKCGYKPAPPEAPKLPTPDLSALVSVKSTGTVK